AGVDADVEVRGGPAGQADEADRAGRRGALLVGDDPDVVALGLAVAVARRPAAPVADDQSLFVLGQPPLERQGLHRQLSDGLVVPRVDLDHGVAAARHDEQPPAVAGEAHAAGHGVGLFGPRRRGQVDSGAGLELAVHEAVTLDVTLVDAGIEPLAVRRPG